MASDEIVVSNTSPLLNLALIGRTTLLRDQFESVTIPVAVRDELLAGERGREPLEKLFDSHFVVVESVRRDDLVREFRTELDRGEAEALALAIERDAAHVLIDEREGRRAARRHDLSVTGVVGILIKAARAGSIEIESALEELRDAGFWIDDELVDRAIEAVETVK